VWYFTQSITSKQNLSRCTPRDKIAREEWDEGKNLDLKGFSQTFDNLCAYDTSSYLIREKR